MSHLSLKFIQACFYVFLALYKSLYSVKKRYICYMRFRAEISELRAMTQNIYYRQSNNALNPVDLEKILKKAHQLKRLITRNTIYIPADTYETLNFMLDNLIFTSENEIFCINQIFQTLNMMYFLAGFIK